jgi:hypothetical protein
MMSKAAAIFAVMLSLGSLVTAVIYANTQGRREYVKACEERGGQAVHNGQHYECFGRTK